jgi:hypothetical protein
MVINGQNSTVNSAQSFTSRFRFLLNFESKVQIDIYLGGRICSKHLVVTDVVLIKMPQMMFLLVEFFLVLFWMRWGYSTYLPAFVVDVTSEFNSLGDCRTCGKFGS